MNTIETIAFLQKRKKEKKYTKGIRVYVNTFEYDIRKKRARANKFCEEKEIASITASGIEVKTIDGTYLRSSMMIREYYAQSTTISLTKKEALREYKRIMKSKEEELEKDLNTKKKMLKNHIEKAEKLINGKPIVKKKKNNKAN